MSYWDTSALAKLYVSEPDSADFERHAAAASQIAVSAIGRLELRAVLRRREAEGSPQRRFHEPAPSLFLRPHRQRTVFRTNRDSRP